MIRYVLLDIEGTTTDINFVHKVLFPYSEARLPQFVATHAGDPTVQACLQAVQETVKAESGHEISEQAAVTWLIQWIHEDRKHTALKQLQGLIWKQGFETGDYKGHVYEDVPECLERWVGEGLKLGIYSSGSVQAQQQLFGHSVHGDLTVYFSDYFDTNIGGKKEADSYRQIARQLDFPPSEILFLSDHEAELDAAAEAGFKVTQLIREGTSPSTRHPVVSDFREILLPSAVSG